MKYDHTSLSCLERCEQEWVFRHRRNLVPPSGDAAAVFGQVVHAGIRVLYDGGTESAVTERMFTEWEVAAVAARLQGVEMGLLDSKKPHLTLDRAHAIVATYWQVWADQRDRFDVVWNEGYAESAIECALPDRCIRLKADGRLYAMDLKTTSMYVTGAWQERYAHSMQAAMQLDVLEHVLGERLEGFWLDGVQIPTSKVAAISSKQFFRYGPLAYSEGLRAELRATRAMLAARANDLAAYPQAARKSLGACMRYNRLCDYFNVCRAEPNQRETLVQIALDKGALVERAWIPKERL